MAYEAGLSLDITIVGVNVGKHLFYPIIVLSGFLSHGQDTIHAEKGCAEMCDFHMAALMFLTSRGRKARTHAQAEIACSLVLPKP